MHRLRFSGLILLMMALFAATATLSDPYRNILLGFCVAAVIPLLLSLFFAARTRLKTADDPQAAWCLPRDLTDRLTLIHQDLQAAKADAIKNEDFATVFDLSTLESEIGVIRDHFPNVRWGQGMGRDTKALSQSDKQLAKEIQDAVETSEKLRETAHIGGPETLKRMIAELKQQITSLSDRINHG